MRKLLGIVVCYWISTFVYADDNALFNTQHTLSSSLAARNYITLQQSIALYEKAINHPWPIISPRSGLLKPGMKNHAVFALRQRLLATGELKYDDPLEASTFDENLTSAVMAFQSTHGLNPDGVVGASTLAQLNISPAQRITQIEVNMARWSKLAGHLGNNYIMVNVPAYTMDLVENGATVLSMKAIVGKPTRPTPEIESTITRIVLNPYWNVPKLIAQKDIVPKILNDPNYLDEMNIKILNRDDEDDSSEIDPSEIDWQEAEDSGFRYHFRQEPGENNALGLVKFEFQNSHDIYMHDTPAKELFDADKRDFSSGCIRLERPFELVSLLMQGSQNWSEEREQSILEEGKTSYIKIPHPIPVIIAYLTVFVDDQGQLQFRDDIYGWDQPDPPAQPEEPQ